LVDIVEAVVGTVFLSPVVFAAVIWCNQDPSVVISIAGVLALPIGWLIHTFSRFIFTFRGDYEHFPTMKFVRKRIKVAWDLDKKQCTVDLAEALPQSRKGGNLATRLVISANDFKMLFDPYESLKKSKVPFFKSYRAKQEKEKEELPYVENVENMFFFDAAGLAGFIRSAATNYHTYLAVGWAALFGVLFSLGLTLSLSADAFNRILPALQAITLMNFIGVLVCAGVVLFLVWAAVRQSRFRKNEAVANEYLMIRLRLEKQNNSKNDPQKSEGDRNEAKQIKSKP